MTSRKRLQLKLSGIVWRRRIFQYREELRLDDAFICDDDDDELTRMCVFYFNGLDVAIDARRLRKYLPHLIILSAAARIFDVLRYPPVRARSLTRLL